MAIFSAPAWMMKSGGAVASATGSGDDDPFKTRTSVAFSLSNFVFKRNSYTISFKIDESGFTTKNGKVWIEVNRDSTGQEVHWQHYDLGLTVNLQGVGSSFSYSFSRQLNKAKDIKQCIDYTSNSDIYFLFLTDNEICPDQIHPTVEGDPTPIPQNS